MGYGECHSFLFHGNPVGEAGPGTQAPYPDHGTQEQDCVPVVEPRGDTGSNTEFEIPPEKEGVSPEMEAVRQDSKRFRLDCTSGETEDVLGKQGTVNLTSQNSARVGASPWGLKRNHPKGFFK